MAKYPEGVVRRDYLFIPVNLIVVKDQDNYATSDRGDIEGLAQTIASEGIRDPLHCYRNGDGQFILRAGFRRMKAVQLLNKDRKTKIERVPVILEDKHANTSDRAIWQLLENAHRADAEAIEKAQAYRTLIEVNGMTVKEISTRMGESEQTIKRTLFLLQASQSLRKAMENGEVSPTAVAKIVKNNPEDEEAQKAALKLAVQASGGKKATAKGAAKATKKQKSRQRVRGLSESQDGHEYCTTYVKQHTLGEKVQIKYKAYLAMLNWNMGGPAPWE